MIGINFNNKHSYNDFGLIQISFSSLIPSKKKIKGSVPFMNGSYDFSTVGSNGEIVYAERTLKGKYFLKATNKAELYQKYESILQWLMESGKARLESDKETDIYYLAEVENAPSLEELLKCGTITIEWVAEPFRLGKDYVGQESWDNINFETFIIQDTSFSVVGSQTVVINNPGKVIAPDVIVSANMSCILNGYTANFTTTMTKDYKFKLQNGNNTIVINGTGNIEFRFRKEVL